MSRTKKAQIPPMAVSHLEAINEAGFEVLRYQNKALEVQCSDGTVRREWLPEDFVNWSAKRFVRWCEDEKYNFSGWEPQDGHTFGGRYQTPLGALSWFIWKDAQK
jgi:hypothetical protein